MLGEQAPTNDPDSPRLGFSMWGPVPRWQACSVRWGQGGEQGCWTWQMNCLEQGAWRPGVTSFSGPSPARYSLWRAAPSGGPGWGFWSL